MASSDDVIHRLRELLVSEMGAAHAATGSTPRYEPVACPCCGHFGWSSAYQMAVNAAGEPAAERYDGDKPRWWRCWWCLALAEFVPDESPAGGHFGQVIADGKPPK